MAIRNTGLMRLLGRLGAGVGEVTSNWRRPAPRRAPRSSAALSALAERTGLWAAASSDDAEAAAALAGVAILAARSEDEEARAIACAAPRHSRRRAFGRHRHARPGPSPAASVPNCGASASLSTMPPARRSSTAGSGG